MLSFNKVFIDLKYFCAKLVFKTRRVAEFPDPKPEK